MARCRNGAASPRSLLLLAEVRTHAVEPRSGALDPEPSSPAHRSIRDPVALCGRPASLPQDVGSLDDRPTTSRFRTFEEYRVPLEFAGRAAECRRRDRPWVCHCETVRWGDGPHRTLRVTCLTIPGSSRQTNLRRARPRRWRRPCSRECSICRGHASSEPQWLRHRRRDPG
jgi:hypothetical protein